MLPRDLQLVDLAAHRPLELPDLLLQLPLAGALLLARQRLAATLQQLLAPRVVERLGDLVLPADLLHRPIATQPGEHDLDRLLGRELPVPALLAQRRLLVA
jgi:hypothetical protein